MKHSLVFVMNGSPDDVFRACQRAAKDMRCTIKSMSGNTMVLKTKRTLTRDPITLNVQIRERRDGSSNLGVLGSLFGIDMPIGRTFIGNAINSFANGVDVELRQAGSRTTSSTPEPPPAEPEFSVADELGKLADLRDRGVLSEEEFQEQKMKLLE